MNPNLDIQLLESQAIHLINHKRLSQAHIKVLRALKYSTRKNGYLYSHLADILSEKKQYAKAQQNYQKSILIVPNLAHAYYNWAVTLAIEEKYPEASLKLAQVIKINPWNIDAIHQLGKTYLKQQLYEEADQAFRTLVALNPRYYKVYGEWAYARYFLRDFEGAKKYLYKGLRADGNDLEVHNMLGYILLIEQKYREAICCFKKAIEKNPLYTLAWLNWSLALALQGKEKEAKEKFNKGIETLRKEEKDRKKEIIGIYKLDLEVLEEYVGSIKDQNKKGGFVVSIEGVKRLVSLLEEENESEKEVEKLPENIDLVGV